MIAFLINDLDIRGGTHKQFLKMLDYMSSTEIDFIVITRVLDFDKTFPGFKKYVHKINVIDVKYSNNNFVKIFNYIKTLFLLRKVLKSIDVVNIHDGGYEILLPALIGKKVFWQINDLHYCFKVGVGKGKSSFADICRRNLIKLFSPVVNEFSVNVTKNKLRIKEVFNRDAHVFYCGIEKLAINRNQQLTLDRFKHKKINILSSGVFMPYRNYETQIQIVKDLVDKGIDAHLNIIGSTALDKTYSTKIIDLIKDVDLEKNITVCGLVDEEEFEELHKNADIFIFINVDQSWGLAVFEAMSCGLPVFVSNSVGATEILTDNENAVFVDPFNVESISNNILDLMSDPQNYCYLAKNSVDFCDSFSWENAYCSKMLALMSTEL